MAFDKWLFGLIVAFGLLLVVIMLIPQPENATGFIHPRFATMNQGGSASRHDQVLPLALANGPANEVS